MELLNVGLHLEGKRGREHSSLGQEELYKEGKLTWRGGGGGIPVFLPLPPPFCVN